MTRALILVLAGLAVAGTPEDDAWERRVLGALVAHGEDMARIEQLGPEPDDRALVQLLAAYGVFRAQGRGLSSRPNPRELDSLQAAAQRAELAFLVRMRNFQPSLARLADGGGTRKEDSLLVKAMASYVSMRMQQLTPKAELRR